MDLVTIFGTIQSYFRIKKLQQKAVFQQKCVQTAFFYK